MTRGWSVSDAGVEALQKAIESYGQGAGERIKEVYEEFAADKIAESMLRFVHPSGRRFKGHTKGAREAGIERVFQHSVDGMTLTVQSKGKFGYLYFPDTGIGHQPRVQDIVGKGLDASQDEIIERCVAKLLG